MTRYPEIHIPGGMYSVVSKCNNNEFLFDSDDKFELYLRHLLYCKNKLRFRLYDIVCMMNHIHELYELPLNNVTIGKILHTVKGHFSQKFNTVFGRSGHFWRNKPWYRIIENERYAIATCQYFHTNPVRAGLVSHPSQWPYSGYRFHEMGERKGIIGELLDPLPGIDVNPKIEPATPAERDYIAKLLQKKSRFVGSRLFIKKMTLKYGQLNTL
jgi:putative transposase